MTSHISKIVLMVNILFGLPNDNLALFTAYLTTVIKASLPNQPPILLHCVQYNTITVLLYVADPLNKKIYLLRYFYLIPRIKATYLYSIFIQIHISGIKSRVTLTNKTGLSVYWWVFMFLIILLVSSLILRPLWITANAGDVSVSN